MIKQDNAELFIYGPEDKVSAEFTSMLHKFLEDEKLQKVFFSALVALHQAINPKELKKLQDLCQLAYDAAEKLGDLDDSFDAANGGEFRA